MVVGVTELFIFPINECIGVTVATALNEYCWQKVRDAK